MYRFNDMFDNPTPEYLPSKNMEDRLYISSGSGKRWYSPGELENDNGERDIWTTLWHGWMDGWMNEQLMVKLSPWTFTILYRRTD